MSGGEEMHQHAVATFERADALLFGRVIYEMMEGAWRLPLAEGMPAYTEPFARTIDAAKQYVVSTTLKHVDWNAELVHGDLREAVLQLKQQPGKGLYTGGLTLARTLTEMRLIDEYEFIVHPRIAGHGPTLFDGLSKPIDLKLVDRIDFPSGAVALRYVPRA